MLTYSLLYPSANLTQQRLLRPSSDLDLVEASRYALYGGLWHANIVHAWMGAADRWFPGTAVKAVAKKVRLADCTSMARRIFFNHLLGNNHI